MSLRAPSSPLGKLRPFLQVLKLVGFLFSVREVLEFKCFILWQVNFLKRITFLFIYFCLSDTKTQGINEFRS